MKKTYIKPSVLVTKLVIEGHLLGMSDQGKDYNPDDVTYGKENEISSGSIWGDSAEEE